jgi:hypothetical protein
VAEKGTKMASDPPAGHGATDEEIMAAVGASEGPADRAPDGLLCEQIVAHAVASATVGIWRFSGGTWSAVLKVLRHQVGDYPLWQSGEPEGHWYYWRREALAYASGLLTGLPGLLRAPRCLGVFERPDGTIGLWLEDLSGAASAASWSLDNYRAAAFALGQAQGGAAATHLPAQPWLARNWLRRYVERRESSVAELDDEQAWHVPLVTHHLAPDLGEEIRNIWMERERLLAVVESGPQTLCHLDLHPANLFAVGGDTVIIDWAFVGIGGMGEDAGNLIVDAVLDFFVPPEQMNALVDTITEGYLEGLTASGWNGDGEAVLRTMHASAAVKFFWLLPAMLEAAAIGRATLNHRPIEEGFAYWAPVIPELIAFSHKV